ncbi:MAG: hypothetical protein KDK53_10110 [Maritimibacter sp.]|nr:hypothetical protein [Maritimibacter sp.]
MRNLFVPALIVATLGTSSFAYAETAGGVIQSIDRTQGFVTLDNGARYDFTDMANHENVLTNFKTGDTVAINYVTQGSAAAANSISPVTGSHKLTGVIEQIDPETQRVTVSGVQFDLSQLPDIGTRLKNFKTGDRVQVAYGLQGTGLTGMAISPAMAGDNSLTAAVTNIDPETGTVTVKGGMQVKFETGDLKARLGNFKDGDMVQITYAHQGSALIGETISPAG